MRSFYRINVTDAYYPQDGVSAFLVESEDVFNAFVACERVSQVVVPEEFEDDGAHEWLYSVSAGADEGQSIFPYILLNETDLWSNC